MAFPGLGNLSPYAGLLNEQQRKAAQFQGVMGTALGLLQASGPTRVPMGLGPAMGQAGQQGLGAYNQAAGQGARSNLLGAQLDTTKLNQQLAQRRLDTPPERKTLQDIGGFHRYADTGEKVFPEAEKPGAEFLSDEEKGQFGVPLDAIVQRTPDGKFEVKFPPQGRAQTPRNYLTRDGRRGITMDGLTDEQGRRLPEQTQIISTQIQAKGYEELGPTRGKAGEIRGYLGQLGRGRTLLSRIATGLKEDPGRGGIIGTLRSATQTGVGIFADIARNIPGIDMADNIAVALEGFQADLQTGKVDPQAKGFLFDKFLPQAEVWQRSLAYSIARARKGPGKLNLDDLKSARKDIDLRGFKDVPSIVARINALDQELALAEQDFERQQEGKSYSDDGDYNRSSLEATAQKYGISVDEVVRRLKNKEGAPR